MLQTNSTEVCKQRMSLTLCLCGCMWVWGQFAKGGPAKNTVRNTKFSNDLIKPMETQTTDLHRHR